MSFDVLSDVNWLAVLVAAVAWFALGGGWYAAPPISARWMKAGGIEMEEGASPDPRVFILTFVIYVVIAAVMAMFGVATGTDSAGEGAVLGFLSGLFLVGAAGISAIYDQKPEPFNHFWINGLFNLVGLLIVGIILGSWT